MRQFALLTLRALVRNTTQLQGVVDGKRCGLHLEFGREAKLRAADAISGDGVVAGGNLLSSCDA